MKKNIIQDKSFEFALLIIMLYKELVGKREYVLSKQILKSGTSIGANIEEAIAAQSRKDFLSKLSIALKESRETRYWLRLLESGKLVDVQVTKHLFFIEEIINILTRIIKSTSEKQNL